MKLNKIIVIDPREFLCNATSKLYRAHLVVLRLRNLTVMNSFESLV